MTQSRSKKVTVCAALVAVGLIIGYIESFIILPVNVPGIRIGLANIVSIIALYLFGPGYSAAVLILRVILASMLFGSPVSFSYSIAGALCAFAAMVTLKRFGFSVYGVSVGGGAAHNIAQLAVAYFFVGSAYVFTYMPALVLAGIIAGLITGALSDVIGKRLVRLSYDSERNDKR